MTQDLRCCGAGVCLINAEGLCWCGQRWDADQMCPPQSASKSTPAPDDQGQEAAECEAPFARQPDPSARVRTAVAPAATAQAGVGLASPDAA